MLLVQERFEHLSSRQHRDELRGIRQQASAHTYHTSCLQTQSQHSWQLFDCCLDTRFSLSIKLSFSMKSSSRRFSPDSTPQVNSAGCGPSPPTSSPSSFPNSPPRSSVTTSLICLLPSCHSASYSHDQPITVSYRYGGICFQQVNGFFVIGSLFQGFKVSTQVEKKFNPFV